jgi:hypothetical protein
MDILHSRVRTVRVAAGILGGDQKLATFLGVPAREVQAWLDGQTEPPLKVFLAALDVVAAGPLGPGKRRIRVAVLRDH